MINIYMSCEWRGVKEYWILYENNWNELSATIEEGLSKFELIDEIEM